MSYTWKWWIKCKTCKKRHANNILCSVLVGCGQRLLRMYCIDTEALVFMFNGGSSYGFTIHPSHIKNEMYLHHCFLAPRGYLCSTSLRGSVKLISTNLTNLVSLRQFHHRPIYWFTDTNFYKFELFSLLCYNITGCPEVAKLHKMARGID